MNVLTFDVEEWFHLLDNDSTRTANEWEKYECRIHRNMERIFSILDYFQIKATFFCLGWIAQKYPEIIKSIVSRGYEVGTHTQMHQLIYEQKPDVFRNDLEYSVKTLEDISGQKVRYFRAPGFSIKESNKWAFEILVQQGIEVDSSVFPAPRAHGGFPSYEGCSPSIIRYNGIELKEMPINYIVVGGKAVIFSGGGYFRLFPYALIKRWMGQSDYVMSYLHPRDFDEMQPVINELSLLRICKSYIGLKGASVKLEHWLRDYDFMDVQTAVAAIDWKKVPIVKV